MAMFFRVKSDRITNWHSINYNFRWSKHFIKAFEVHCNLGVIVSKWLFSIVTLPLLLWGCLAICEWPGSSDGEALDCWAEWLLKWISECFSFLVITTLEASETARWLVLRRFVTWRSHMFSTSSFFDREVSLIRSHWKYKRYNVKETASHVPFTYHTFKYLSLQGNWSHPSIVVIGTLIALHKCVSLWRCSEQILSALLPFLLSLLNTF